jgi:hypothetical protein
MQIHHLKMKADFFALSTLDMLRANDTQESATAQGSKQMNVLNAKDGIKNCHNVNCFR